MLAADTVLDLPPPRVRWPPKSSLVEEHARAAGPHGACNQSQYHGYRIIDAIPCGKLLHRLNRLTPRPILDPITYLHAFGELAAAAEYFPK
jgi:hypothetical protein